MPVWLPKFLVVLTACKQNYSLFTPESNQHSLCRQRPGRKAHRWRSGQDKPVPRRAGVPNRQRVICALSYQVVKVQDSSGGGCLGCREASVRKGGWEVQAVWGVASCPSSQCCCLVICARRHAGHHGKTQVMPSRS